MDFIVGQQNAIHNLTPCFFQDKSTFNVAVAWYGMSYNLVDKSKVSEGPVVFIFTLKMEAAVSSHSSVYIYIYIYTFEGYVITAVGTSNIAFTTLHHYSIIIRQYFFNSILHSIFPTSKIPALQFKIDKSILYSK